MLELVYCPKDGEIYGLASFVDAFLSFNSESYLERFKLKYYGYSDDDDNPAEIGLVSGWINTVVDRKLKHLHVWDDSDEEIQLPPNLYTCESLVSLKLINVNLGSPKFVSLPSLKVMDLTPVQFANDLELETLISCCPVLEYLFIKRSGSDYCEGFRVCSQSLLNITCVSCITFESWDPISLLVAINAPKLQYLRLGEECVESFIVNNTSSLVEAYMDTVFNCSFKNKFENELEKSKMIRSFLEGISCVKDMTITSKTLEIIYQYSRCEQLPLFSSLSFLRVIFANHRWKCCQSFLKVVQTLSLLLWLGLFT